MSDLTETTITYFVSAYALTISSSIYGGREWWRRTGRGVLSEMAEGQAVTYKLTKRLDDMEPIEVLIDSLNEIGIVGEK